MFCLADSRPPKRPRTTALGYPIQASHDTHTLPPETHSFQRATTHNLFQGAEQHTQCLGGWRPLGCAQSSLEKGHPGTMAPASSATWRSGVSSEVTVSGANSGPRTPGAIGRIWIGVRLIFPSAEQRVAMASATASGETSLRSPSDWTSTVSGSPAWSNAMSTSRRHSSSPRLDGRRFAVSRNCRPSSRTPTSSQARSPGQISIVRGDGSTEDTLYLI